ncbi:CAF17-like 4Fe-4S cluster assembly/insertion protein YgfZ [Ramlibacter sp. Leaf400]|uniref:CAF17-like 4Fe-4S cluster assembly/insertion protein YgfZ n=1 Tax=Ramlibacter sp. Leaf400 TaxID=1736365 RepID=UPI0006FC08E9|nr:folate-binding protein YgfZ [Ramlibacter sp. Leaf400]KQT10774.1 folate-binding protein [Ramlibacter sp. Leaf400]
MVQSLEGRCALPQLGVIRAQGEEAARFLHNQLTQDFALLPPGQARLAAFCNAKGRMLASFVGVPLGADQILLVTSRDLLAPTLKRLSMFVLRSRVKLSDASDEFALFGLAGDAAAKALGGPREPWAQHAAGAAQVVSLYPADGQPRALWIAPAGEAPPAGAELPLEAWLWGKVRSGIASITAPVTELFVPQMLNYESVGGVNFKKGCYPGQEVVARSQFRGTLKRRGYVVHGPAAMQAGQEVFHEGDPSQPCGTVVEAAPAPAGGWDAIVSMQTSAAESGRLTVGSAEGPALERLPLPYPLLADI